MGFMAVSKVTRRCNLCLPRWRGALLLLAFFAGIVPAGRAQVTTSIWLGTLTTGTGDWSNSLFWDVLPVAGNNVTINNLVFPAVVTLDVDATVNQLTLGTGASLTMSNGRTLTLGSSTINGSLSINSTGTATSLLIGSATTTFSGSGTITLSANANNQIRGAVSTNRLVNQVTIQGAGSLGAGQLALTNQGSIIASSSSVPLVVQPNASGIINTGTMTATGGATLTVQSGTINNAGGTILAQTGSIVTLSNVTLASGNITTVGTGEVKLADATLAGVTVSNSANGIIRAVSGVNTLLGAYTDFVTSQVRVGNGAKVVLPIGTGTVTLNGGIFVDSTGSDTVVEIGTTGMTINGAGRLVLSNNANNRVIGTGGTSSVTFGPSLTVHGSGQLGGGLLGITNQGTILADQSNPLIVRPSSLGLANTGTMRAATGGSLTLQSGTFTNTGAGSIISDTGSHIDVSGSTISGGTLTSSGTGHFHALDASTFSGLTISTGTTVEVDNGHSLTLKGSIVNNGLISLLAAGSATELKMDGAVTLGGSGNVTMTNSASNRIHGAAGSALTLGANQTISGAGEIGRDTMSFTNQGTVTANHSTALVINNSGTSFTNHGALKATGSGGLTLSDATVMNLGTVEVFAGSIATVAGAYTQTGNSSATKLASGTFTASSFSLQGGSLGGAGTVNGAVSASGSSSIAPGGVGAAGTLTFNSSLSLGSSTSLLFDLGGTVAGSGHDRINGTNITLSGSLLLSFINGFQSTITSANTLTLISTSALLNGTFSGLPDGARLATADGLGSFQVNYLSNALTISNFQAIPEPSTYLLLALGGFGVIARQVLRRRRK
jgi:hypothetical protein